ncbi:LamG domain-containing protein, partial [Candidatus Woesearchaeota archaeon]|nr:LamG domain-containing protein [Candidatus Woesearchaeota archaeon]
MGSKKRTRKKYLALALALLLVSVFALVFIWSLESDSNMLNRYLTPFNSLTGASVGFPDEAIASSSEVSLSGEVSLSAVPTITAVTLTATSALNRTSDNLSASVSGLSAGTNVTYNWYLNGASITVLNMPMTNASWSPDAQTTYDFSGYNNNGTLGTNLLADVAEPNYTTSCVIGGCYIFDGRNDTINVGNASNLNFAANESFSISVWFKAAAFTTGDHLIDKRGTSGPGYSLGTGSIAASTLDFNVWGASGSPQASKTGLSANQWYHAVGVRDTASDRIFLYVNGVLAENTADSTTGHINSTNSVTIGSRVDQSAGFFFNGSIDEVRIYRRALSEAQIKALYNSESTNYANNLTVEQEILPGEAWNVSATPIDFQGQNGTTYFSTNLINIAAINNTAPSITSASLSPANPTTSDNLTSTVSGLTDANGDSTNVTYNWYVNGTSITVLNLPFTYHMFSSNETYTNDFSGNGNDGVIGYNGRGDPLEPQFNRDCAIGGCYTFDGVNDFISVGNASNLNFAANESFSISLWFNSAKFSVGDYLLDKRGASGPGYFLATDSAAASTLNFDVVGASGSPQASKTGLSANQWYYAVGVRDTASDRIFLYVNGILAENTADSTTGHINSTNPVTIGSRTDQSAGFFFNGSIDEVRIYRRAL